MFTIKVIDDRKDVEFRTSLFMGEQVQHGIVEYKSQKDFKEKYEERVSSGGVSNVIGIPVGSFDKDDEEGNPTRGLFLWLVYYQNTKFNVLILQNVTVYIMNNGQTVDRIIC